MIGEFMCEEAGIDIFDVIAEINPDALTMQGWDDCILGMCYQTYSEPVVAYSKDRIIKKLLDDGKTIEEAEDMFGHMYNTDRGENSPVFITVLNEP